MPVVSSDRQRAGLTVVVAARNEADRIGETLAALRDALPGAALRVADDASTDGTAEVAMTAGARGNACSTRVTLIRRPIFSSIHIRPPPAPQHIAFSRVSSNSSGLSRIRAASTARGASYSPL